MNKTLKVIVGLSGGVDSAVAALRLLEQGYQVEALFMKNWDEDDTEEFCPAEADLEDARAVAKTLEIKLHTVSFSTEYWERVFEYFLAEYRAGRTPNPDILCNQEIKFKAFLEYAVSLGAEAIATGHYARINNRGPVCQLLKGTDKTKDQSYFLCRLNQHALRHCHFPLGNLDKTQVRKLAESAGFKNYAKKDSTGICFIGERKFNTFLARYLPAQPGVIISIDGDELGTHQGLMFHTIGQREGLGIGGIKSASGEPWYVVGKDLKKNRLLVAQGSQHPALFRSTVQARDLHWIENNTPGIPLSCQARIRYRQQEQDCEITSLHNDFLETRFDSPQRAVTPGQAIVFYQGDICLGGATIQ